MVEIHTTSDSVGNPSHSVNPCFPTTTHTPTEKAAFGGLVAPVEKRQPRSRTHIVNYGTVSRAVEIIKTKTMKVMTEISIEEIRKSKKNKNDNKETSVSKTKQSNGRTVKRSGLKNNDQKSSCKTNRSNSLSQSIVHCLSLVTQDGRNSRTDSTSSTKRSAVNTKCGNSGPCVLFRSKVMLFVVKIILRVAVMFDVIFLLLLRFITLFVLI